MKHHKGSMEVICGSMFCGKSEELIRRLRRATIARQVVQVFKPVIDTRYSLTKVISHSGYEIEATTIDSSNQILTLLKDDVTVVGIDEAQFIDEGLVEILDSLANRGIRVIVAGLDLDFRGEPFGVMPTLMAKAELVDKLQAICMVCGEAACRTQRLLNGQPSFYDDPIVVIGADEMYEARCREHHQVPRRE
ncbi:MAG: thymidine kinase [Anaerolineaceae bacterium]|nr:thymidine kinase [Anaerolineaceae bacterium]